MSRSIGKQSLIACTIVYFIWPNNKKKLRNIIDYTMFTHQLRKPLDLMIIIPINYVYISSKVLAFWNTNCGKQDRQTDLHTYDELFRNVLIE